MIYRRCKITPASSSQFFSTDKSRPPRELRSDFKEKRAKLSHKKKEKRKAKSLSITLLFGDKALFHVALVGDDPVSGESGRLLSSFAW